MAKKLGAWSKRSNSTSAFWGKKAEFKKKMASVTDAFSWFVNVIIALVGSGFAFTVIRSIIEIIMLPFTILYSPIRLLMYLQSNHQTRRINEDEVARDPRRLLCPSLRASVHTAGPAPPRVFTSAEAPAEARGYHRVRVHLNSSSSSSSNSSSNSSSRRVEALRVLYDPPRWCRLMRAAADVAQRAAGAASDRAHHAGRLL